jgi:hypothetical protein
MAQTAIDGRGMNERRLVYFGGTEYEVVLLGVVAEDAWLSPVVGNQGVQNRDGPVA